MINPPGKISSMKLVTLLLLLLAMTAAGVDGPLPRTGGFINGRTWVDMPHGEKVGFILGFQDGIKEATLDNDKARTEYLKAFFGHSRFGEITDGVDDVYRDPANLQIQVTAAMEYFQNKVNGVSPESLAKELAYERKFSADNLDQ
jgi:hypothetical protein